MKCFENEQEPGSEQKQRTENEHAVGNASSLNPTLILCVNVCAHVRVYVFGRETEGGRERGGVLIYRTLILYAIQTQAYHHNKLRLHLLRTLE